jgi:hypothetical protein
MNQLMIKSFDLGRVYFPCRPKNFGLLACAVGMDPKILGWCSLGMRHHPKAGAIINGPRLMFKHPCSLSNYNSPSSLTTFTTD